MTKAYLILSAALAGFAANGAMPVTHREATNVAERVIASEVRVASTPIPESKTNLLTYVRAKAHPVTGEVRDEDENGSVVIGKDANGTISTNFMNGVSRKTQLRSEAVAIGHNATVTYDGHGETVQGVAVGWNAKADGSNAIAIGSGAKHWYEQDEEGDRTYAKGSEAVAFGYCARATAARAVQIGEGINAERESLKFRNVWIVKDGKVQGGVGSNEVVDAVAEYLRPRTVTGTDEIAVRSHALTVYSPSEVAEEVSVTATGSRNYEIYIPDTEPARASLPILFDADFEGAVTVGSWWTNRIDRLPALVRVREPVPGTCVLDVEIYGE